MRQYGGSRASIVSRAMHPPKERQRKEEGREAEKKEGL